MYGGISIGKFIALAYKPTYHLNISTFSPILEESAGNEKKTDIVRFVLLTITIAFCKLFPIKLSGGIISDLRFFPFVYGCLYANRITGLWMLFLIFALRIIYGADHSWFAIFSIFIFYCLIIRIKPIYFRLSLTGKLLFSSFLMLLMSIWALGGVAFFYHTSLNLLLSISFIFIQTAGMFIVGYLVENIKNQQRVLRRLIGMEKMEVASHLAASIFHEIRNPLTSSKGFLQLLGESEESPGNLKNITIASNELDQAERIIRDYLTFAKPTPGEFDKLTVKNEIEKAVRIIEPLAKMSLVNLSAKTCSAFIKGNSGMFQQVLINIIKNGIEAMPKGGILSIDNMMERSNAVIYVKDKGVGMTDLQKSCLGEPYYSTKESQGTGLGMMLVYRIFRSMNGTIHIESEPGTGTRITLRFPIIDP